MSDYDLQANLGDNLDSRVKNLEGTIRKAREAFAKMSKNLDILRQQQREDQQRIANLEERLAKAEKRWKIMSDELVEHLSLHDAGKAAPLKAPAPAAPPPTSAEESAHPF